MVGRRPDRDGVPSGQEGGQSLPLVRWAVEDRSDDGSFLTVGDVLVQIPVASASSTVAIVGWADEVHPPRTATVGIGVCEAGRGIGRSSGCLTQRIPASGPGHGQ